MQQYDESAKLSCSASDNTTLNITNNFDSLIGAQQINSGEMTISKSDTTEKTILCRLTYENVSRDTTVKKKIKLFSILRLGRVLINLIQYMMEILLMTVCQIR